MSAHPLRLFKHAVAITPSDSVNLVTTAAALYVGGAGDVTAVMESGVTVLFKAVPVGTVLPVQVNRVNSTATTATNLLALY